LSKYIDLNRIEFVVTNSCSGHCKHCSNGEQPNRGESVRAEAAVKTVKQLAERFTIESVMTFGGEPMLYADTVCAIHAAARDCGIPERQLITNGYFSKDESVIDKTAKALCNAGVNDILLSADAFHQEYIPLEPVMAFADALLRHHVPRLRVQPAWVVNEEHDNPYNRETERILTLFTDKGIMANEGNNIFPSGNALKHLSEYFSPPDEMDLFAPCGSFPYTGRIDEVTSVGINPNGDVTICSPTIGNIYKTDVLDIVDTYDPYANPAFEALLTGGAEALLKYAKTQGIEVDITDCRSACGVCRKAMAALKESVAI
jgi:MoaA/NifB/PqqE/SkfB family radical SAM enzyme